MKNCVRITFLILVCTPIILFSQEEKRTISIIIRGDSTIFLTGASVNLYSGGKVIGSSISDSSGKCWFSVVPSGSLRMFVSYAGYIPFQENLGLIVRDTSFQVNLKLDVKQLSGVTVFGKKPPILMEPDRYIVNVDGKTNLGRSVSDVLKKLPGVVVNNDQIQVEGKPVTVQINGKSVLLTGTDLINYLSTNSSTNINQIEVITTPPSKYDASYSGAVINLKLRKLNSDGYNGNFTIDLGHRSEDPNEELDGSLNIRKGKINFFSNAGIYHDKQISETNTDRNYNPQSGVTRITENNHGATAYNGVNFRFGSDYSIDKRNVLGILINGDYSKADGNLFNVSNIFNSSIADSINLLDFNSTKRKSLSSFNINYKGQLDSNGQELNIDLDADIISSRNDGLQTYDYLLPGGGKYKNSHLLNQLTKSRSNIYGIKVDYVKPFKYVKLEAGTKFTVSDVSHDLTERQNNIPDTGFSAYVKDEFIYKEKIWGIYATISGKHKFIRYQLGMRGELTDISGNSISTGQVFSKDYFNLFPTVSLSANIDKKQILSFSYRRSVTRPRFDQLNPFRYYLSPYFYFTGNPYLLSFYPDNLRIGYSYGNFFQTSLSYTISRDRILEYTILDTATRINKGVKDNNGNSESLNWSSSYYSNITKWWYNNTTINVVFENFSFKSNEQNIARQNNGYSVSSNNKITFSKTFLMEIFGYYSSARYFGVGYYKPFWYVDMSFSKEIFKGKGQLSLKIRDIFYTNVTRYGLNYGDVDYSVVNRWDSRRLNLSLFYMFGNKGVKSPRSRGASANSDVRSRAN